MFLQLNLSVVSSETQCQILFPTDSHISNHITLLFASSMLQKSYVPFCFQGFGIKQKRPSTFAFCESLAGIEPWGGEEAGIKRGRLMQKWVAKAHHQKNQGLNIGLMFGYVFASNVGMGQAFCNRGAGNGPLCYQKCPDDQVRDLASIDCWGTQLGNCHRDLLRKLGPISCIPMPENKSYIDPKMHLIYLTWVTVLSRCP